MGAAKDDIIPQTDSHCFNPLGKFRIKWIGNSRDDETQCFGSPHHQTSCDKIGSVIYFSCDGKNLLFSLIFDTRFIIERP